MNTLKNSFIKNKRFLIIIVSLIFVFLIARYSGLYNFFNIQELQALLKTHWIISSIIFILLFIASSFIQIPGWILLVTAVLSFGKIQGGILTYIAAIISCSIVFLSISYIGKGSIKKLKFKWTDKVLAQLERHPIRSVIILRFVFQTAPPLNYTLALSDLRFKNYLIGTAIGLPIPIAIYIMFFDVLLLNRIQ